MSGQVHGIPLRRGITDPVGRLWPRTPGSVRRTVTISAIPRDGDWALGYAIEGVAHDQAIGTDGTLQGSAQARLSAAVDAMGTVLTMEIADDRGARDLTEQLTGRNIGPGFRARLAQIDAAPADSLAGVLLDDLSGIRHVAGYGRIVTGPQVPGFLANSPQVGTCAGWMAGGVAALATGDHILADLPTGPLIHELLTDPLDWHEEPPVPAGSVQRRRLLDAVPMGDGSVDLELWFRDSVRRSAGPDGGMQDAALHEYTVSARLDAAGRLADARAVPRTLPMGDCPLAAQHVSLLEGRTVDQLDAGVRAHLRGELGCTHLNDAMRFLRSTTTMLDKRIGA